MGGKCTLKIGGIKSSLLQASPTPDVGENEWCLHADAWTRANDPGSSIRPHRNDSFGFAGQQVVQLGSGEENHAKHFHSFLNEGAHRISERIPVDGLTYQLHDYGPSHEYRAGDNELSESVPWKRTQKRNEIQADSEHYDQATPGP